MDDEGHPRLTGQVDRLIEQGDERVVAENERASLEDYPGIAGRMDRLIEQGDALQIELVKENEKRDKRIRGNRILTIVSILAAVLGLSVGGYATYVGAQARHDADIAKVAADKAQAALDLVKKNTTAARKGGCLAYNVQQKDQAAAEKSESHDFVAALAANSSDPNIGAKVAAFNKSHDAKIDAAHKPRNCTPKGIEEYLKAKNL